MQTHSTSSSADADIGQTRKMIEPRKRRAAAAATVAVQEQPFRFGLDSQHPNRPTTRHTSRQITHNKRLQDAPIGKSPTTRGAAPPEWRGMRALAGIGEVLVACGRWVSGGPGPGGPGPRRAPRPARPRQAPAASSPAASRARPQRRGRLRAWLSSYCGTCLWHCQWSTRTRSPQDPPLALLNLERKHSIMARAGA